MTFRIPCTKPLQGMLVTFLLVILAPLAPATSWAATVTTNQAGMNAIYSQPSFGVNTIDIRFNPTVFIANSSLLDITTLAELNTLFGLSPASSPGINMFFVDTVSVCTLPDPTPSITGCATINGNDIVVESAVAAGSSGALLNSHELGHNLGLPHTTECAMSFPDNLMDCQLLGSDLTSGPTGQVNTILASSLIQTDPGGKFVSITPVLIVPIPVPAAAWLFTSALIVLVRMRR